MFVMDRTVVRVGWAIVNAATLHMQLNRKGLNLKMDVLESLELL
jgi:hypothetical protein